MGQIILDFVVIDEKELWSKPLSSDIIEAFDTDQVKTVLIKFMDKAEKLYFDGLPIHDAHIINIQKLSLELTTRYFLMGL